jgi:Family of unknown function (DUF6527)
VKKWFRQFLEGVRWIPRTDLVATISEEHPNQGSLPPSVLHVVGGKNYQKWAYLNCPCNCGALIMLSLAAARRPHWQVAIDWLDRPTVKPSVWQTEGCYSHFWIKQGRVEWVKDTGTRPPPANFYA